MIEEINVVMYKTSDGLTHEYRGNAIEHEIRIYVQKALPENTDRLDTFNYIMRHRNLLYKIFNEGKVTMSEGMEHEIVLKE